MANQYDDDDDYDFSDKQDEGPANLRKALKKRERELKNLEEQLSSLKGTLRERSVKDVLETKGVNPKIASFIPSDVSAPEQIAAWLDEHADVFGLAVNQSEKTELSENDVAQQRIDNATNSASVPQRDGDLMNKIMSAGSKEELAQLMGHQVGRFR